MGKTLEATTREVMRLLGDSHQETAAQTVHVYPLFGRAHIVDGDAEACWCVPETRREAPGVVLAIHRVVS